MSSRRRGVQPAGGVIVVPVPPLTVTIAMRKSSATTPLGIVMITVASPPFELPTDPRNVIAGSMTYGRGSDESSSLSSSNQDDPRCASDQRKPRGVMSFPCALKIATGAIRY